MAGRLRKWVGRRLPSRRPTANTEVTVRRVQRGSTYARVNSIGTPGQRAFVLVPGIGVASNYFERLAAELDDFGPVHALDLPGFGGVPHPREGTMSIEEYADLVGQVITELELDDPVLIGHSMGTQVVADLAARYPDGFGADRPLSSIVLLGPVVNAAERRLGVALRRFLRVALREPPRVAVLALYAYVLCGLPWFFRVLPQMMAYTIEETLPRVRSNTLIIAGANDDLVPGAWVEEVTELVPSARSWIIPEAAHSVMHAHADVVARLAVAHARHPGTGPLPVSPADTTRAASAAERHAPEAAKVAAGQIRELIGIITDDDQVIAEGKTLQARALEDEPPPEPDDGTG